MLDPGRGLRNAFAPQMRWNQGALVADSRYAHSAPMWTPASLNGSKTPMPPYRGSSLHHVSCQWRLIGGARRGSGIVGSFDLISEIDEQQSIAALLVEPPQQECALCQYRAGQLRQRPLRQHYVVGSQCQQVFEEVIGCCVLVALGEVQHCQRCGLEREGIENAILGSRSCILFKIGCFPFAVVPQSLRRGACAVCEVRKGAACIKFLAHEDHGCMRSEQQQPGQCPGAPGARQSMQPPPIQSVGDLVVILG